MRHLTVAFSRSKLALLAVFVVLAGCQTTPPIAPTEPDLNLLQAAPLEIPSGCVASGSFAISFTVAPSGRARDIKPANAPSCAYDALITWVESFRYAPPSRPTAMAIEWMMVSAKRGS